VVKIFDSRLRHLVGCYRHFQTNVLPVSSRQKLPAVRLGSALNDLHIKRLVYTLLKTAHRNVTYGLYKWSYSHAQKISHHTVQCIDDAIRLME